jgi:sugar (pentulose or hexulose) kinase
MGAMTGTPNVDWARETLTDGMAFADIEAAARGLSPGAGGVVYLPYLNDAGEKAPFVEPAARAGFVGLEPDHGRDHLLRAVYEGLAMSIRDCAEHIPGTSDRIHISGGGSRSELLCQVFADALNAEVVVPAGEELGALGSAAMAGVAVGEYADLGAAVAETTAVERSHDPRPAVTAFYDDWYGVYRATREGLVESWQRRAAVLADRA